MPLALAGAALLLAGCTTGPGTSTVTVHGTSSAAARSTHTHSTQTRTGSPEAGSLATCTLASLPKQAADTAKDIAAGGPYAYPRNDGVVYQNRNKVLPTRDRGTYREFTVKTPGASNRGTRRIITDGNPTTGAATSSPSAWYYTGDHYNTFCRITDTP